MPTGRLRIDRRRNRGNAGLYSHGDFDLAGFCVGVVDRDKIIDGRKAKAGIDHWVSF